MRDSKAVMSAARRLGLGLGYPRLEVPLDDLAHGSVTRFSPTTTKQTSPQSLPIAASTGCAEGRLVPMHNPSPRDPHERL
jgi:hypothetical protein